MELALRELSFIELVAAILKSLQKRRHPRVIPWLEMSTLVT